MESSTKILRRMLDERGVEHEDKPNFIKWDDAGQYQCFAFETFERQGLLRVHCNLTPEQAIASTLGPAARHPKPHEQWTTVLLPEIAWSWDDSWPDYLSVAHNAHGEWRTYVPEATLGAGTCKRVMDSIDPFAMWVCDHCGHPLDTSENFCGGCGRKVVD